MKDLILAITIGTAICTAALLVPLLIALLLPVATFAIVVLLIWVLIRVFKHDPGGGQNDR